MSIVAIANALLDGRMRERFHSDVAVQATELLLQERTPRDVSVAHPRAEEVGTAARITDPQVPEVRRLTQPARFGAADPPAVEWPLLGDDHRRRLRLQPLERPRDHALARGRRRATTPAATSCCATSRAGRVWSAGFQPCADAARLYEVSFTEDRAEIIRSDGDLVTTLEVQVSSEDDAEVRRAVDQQYLRRVRATSRSPRTPSWCSAPRPPTSRTRRSRRCSCAPNSCARQGVLLANRRRRAPDEPEVWASHHAVIEGVTTAAPGVRNRPPAFHRPRARVARAAGHARGPHAVRLGRHGARRGFRAALPVRVPAGGTARIAFWTCVARWAVAGARTRRQASRPQCAHARRDAGLDPGAGAAAAPRHRRLAGQSLPAARRAHPVCRRRRARFHRRHPPRRRRARSHSGRREFPATCPSC